MIIVKPLEHPEYDFLTDMLYESIFIPEGKPPKQELLSAAALRKYHEGWGRTGDKAFIALKDGKPAGAAWYRLFDETERGYGFVDRDTPELGIALKSEYRKQGIGRLLMNEIIKQAEIDGYRSISLSVDAGNSAAVRLYQGLGFEHCGDAGTSWTMKLDLHDKG